jgi:hypothetical protein
MRSSRELPSCGSQFSMLPYISPDRVPLVARLTLSFPGAEISNSLGIFKAGVRKMKNAYSITSFRLTYHITPGSSAPPSLRGSRLAFQEQRYSILWGYLGPGSAK